MEFTNPRNRAKVAGRNEQARESRVKEAGMMREIPSHSAFVCIRLLAASVVLGALAACAPPEAVRSTAYQSLVWSDEFNGTAIDLAKWSFEIGNGGSNPGWGNDELEYYRTENSSLQTIAGTTGKALVITAKKEPFGGHAYTSSRLKTQGKASWTYGRLEARMKLPEGQGLWPAFWMLGNSISSVGWPQCGEIDIMEMVGGGVKDRTTHGTVHWHDGGYQHRGGSLTLASKLSSGFHVYAVEWTPRALTWSVDGDVYHTQSITAPAFSELHQPAFLLVNLAVGGRWPGNPDATTVFPQEFWIDWIRVYQ